MNRFTMLQDVFLVVETQTKIRSMVLRLSSEMMEAHIVSVCPLALAAVIACGYRLL